LGFYFFELPFYNLLINLVTACALSGAVVYYATARGWQLRRELPGFGSGSELDLRDLRRLGKLESTLFKGLTVLFLLAMAAQFWNVILKRHARRSGWIVAQRKWSSSPTKKDESTLPVTAPCSITSVSGTGARSTIR